MIGTVYKIEIGENIYIGSTIQTLTERQRKHNITLKDNIKKYKLYEECRNYNVEKIICIPLETKEIEDDLEIRELEQEYIEKLKPSLNSYIAYTRLTHKEYNKQDWIKNGEHYRKQKKENYENNKEKINKKRRQDYIKNKEIILEQGKVDITCPICGFVGRKKKLYRHQQTKKCLAASVREI